MTERSQTVIYGSALVYDKGSAWPEKNVSNVDKIKLRMRSQKASHSSLHVGSRKLSVVVVSHLTLHWPYYVFPVL